MTNTGSHGAEAERGIHELNVRAVFEDFAYLNPMRSDRLTELADNVIWFDQTLIVIQDKARQPEATDSPERAERWLKGRATKGIQQARGSARAIQDGRVRTLWNHRRGEVVIDHTAIHRMHLVVILDHPSFPLLSQSDLSSPGSGGERVHVLSRRDWNDIVEEHDTAADLVDWLEQRHELLVSVRAYLDHESDLLARSLKEGRRLTPSDFPSGEVVRGYAGQLADQYRDHFIARKEANRVSRFVDEIIDQVHTAEEGLVSRPEWLSGMTNPGWTYAEIATELARTTRLWRRLLAPRMIEKALSSAEDGLDHYFSAPLPSGTWLLFLTSGKSRQDRATRGMLLTQALKQHQKIDRVLGIATEQANVTGSTFDFWLIDSPYEPDPEFDAATAGAFRPMEHVTLTDFPSASEVQRLTTLYTSPPSHLA